MRAKGRLLGVTLLMVIVAMALAACGAGATPTPTSPANTPTSTPTATPTATPTPQTPSPTPTPPSGWTYHEVKPEGSQTHPGGGYGFFIALPDGWTATPKQGIDSFVGEITGDGVTLHWDLGWYSSPLPYDDDPAYEVTTEEVNGREAKLVRSSSKGATGVYFAEFGEENPDVDTPGVKLTIYGQGLTAEQIATAFQAFHTIDVLVLSTGEI